VLTSQFAKFKKEWGDQSTDNKMKSRGRLRDELKKLLVEMNHQELAKSEAFRCYYLLFRWKKSRIQQQSNIIQKFITYTQ
jgi:hypothetical protein